MKKKERHRWIGRIISENRVATQEELLELLQAREIDTTQATLSRDIRELGLLKQRDHEGRVNYVFPHSLQSSEKRLQKQLQESLIALEQIEFLLVLRTQTGDANLIAAFIDELSFDGVAGTVAGANTLIIIVRSVEQAMELKQKFESWQA